MDEDTVGERICLLRRDAWIEVNGEEMKD